MFKNFRDKIALSGITVLMIGVALLIGTFLSAYGFLTQSLSIIASQDLVQTFGEALAPLIATCIRIMYLGVMGWIGSLLTIRGVTIIAHTPQMPTVVPQKPIPAQQKPLPSPQKAKAEKPQEEAKPEASPSEPEFVVIPPEQVSQPQPEPKEPQKNDSSPQSSNH
jgi:apolipoprotein N-acyltransferase